MATAAILTIGNEIVSGDVANTNATWLAKRLEQLGVRVRSIAALPDEIDEIAPLRARARRPPSTSCSSRAGSAARRTT